MEEVTLQIIELSRVEGKYNVETGAYIFENHHASPYQNQHTIISHIHTNHNYIVEGNTTPKQGK
jgi:hypothetical protein